MCDLLEGDPRDLDEAGRNLVAVDRILLAVDRILLGVGRILVVVHRSLFEVVDRSLPLCLLDVVQFLEPKMRYECDDAAGTDMPRCSDVFRFTDIPRSAI